MDNNDLEFHKAQFSADKFRSIIDLIKHVASVVGVIAALWVIFQGLGHILGGRGPNGIAAFAKVISALHLGSVLGFLWGGGATLAWKLERNGKKRAIKEKSRYQQMVEREDDYRSSSGLTRTGETPRNQEGA